MKPFAFKRNLVIRLTQKLLFLRYQSTRKLSILLLFILWVVPAFVQTAETKSDSFPFAPVVNYGAGSCPVSVFCADLDGDADLDLAVANGYSNNVSIIKNNGNGTFQSAINYGVGTSPNSIFCADLDGDGDLDIAVANYYSNNISLLMNNGNGTFQSAINIGTGGGPDYVICADLDGDGDLDLAVVNSLNDNVSIFKNNGNGTFQSATNYGTGRQPNSVFCADLDDDTDLDLAVANWSGNNVSILKNNGNGTFQSAVTYGAGESPVSVFCADLDGDGDLDLAAANVNSDNVSILKNNGDGTFQSAISYGAGNESYSVFCADLDGDGDVDLSVANCWSNNVSILINLSVELNQGLVGYWSFDEGGGTIAHDATTNHNHGTVYGSPNWVARNGGWALQLDGNDDYVAVPNSASLNPPNAITLAAWYKPVSFEGAGNDPIIDKAYISDTYPWYQYHLGVTGDQYWHNKAEFGFHIAAGGVVTEENFWTPGNWYFLTGTYDGSALKFYVDGNLISQVPVSGTITDYGKPVYFGKFVNRNNYLSGTIDEIRIYNRVLSADEITALYNANPNQGLVGYWKFDEGDGSIAHDSSGNGNDGTIFGANWTTGVSGSALEFVNTDMVSAVPSSFDDLITKALTITAWVRWFGPSSWPHDCIIFDGRGNPPEGFAFYIMHSDGRIAFHMHQGASSAIQSPSTVPTDGSWMHVAVVFDDVSNTLRLFINGALDNRITTMDNYHNSSHQPAIGNNHWAPGDDQWAPLNGTLDEVRIYDRALSEAEIESLYNSVLLADFKSEPTQGCVPLEVQFTDLSPGHPTSWLWDFGDGNTDTAQNPTHTYNDTGFYDVKLVVSNVDTTDTISRYDYIHVGSCHGLVAYWNFDEGSGTTVHDATPNHHDGTIYGATWTTNGASGNALQFDGSNDWMRVPDDNAWAFGSNDFTIVLWQNFDHPGGGSIYNLANTFIANDEGSGSENKWAFAQGGGFLCFHINAPSYPNNLFFPLVPFSPVVGQWYQFAVTRSGNTYTIYVNGGVGGSAVDTHAVPNANAPLTIGWGEGSGTYASGRLDEIRIYSRALSEAEIESLYASTCKHRGDTNGDGTIDVWDVVYQIISYFCKWIPPRVSPDALDVNCDGAEDWGDIVYMIQYLFHGGPLPCCIDFSAPSGSSHQDFNKVTEKATVSLDQIESGEDGFFTIALKGNFGISLSGLQFEISYDAKEVTLFEPVLTSRTEGLQIFSGAQNGVQRIGIVDLKGQISVPPGNGSLITLRGRSTNLNSIKIKEAVLVDRNADKIPVEIVGEIRQAEHDSEFQGSSVPKYFFLSQNHPNPFNPETEISYGLPTAGHVELCIYNLLGKKVRTLVNEYQTAGHKTIHWDGIDDWGKQTATGVYFYRLQAGAFTDAKKMILMK